MGRSIWTRDWFIGLLLSVIFLLAAGTAAFQALERTVYDWGVQFAERSPDERVAVITIDDDSIANLGRWPWPRDLHAQMIRLLHEGGARVIGYSVLFLEPQLDPGLFHLQNIDDYFHDEGIAGLPRLVEDAEDRDLMRQRIHGLEARIAAAIDELDTDRLVAEALAEADNVILGMPFRLGIPAGRPDAELPPYVRASALERIEGGESAGRFIGLPAVDAMPPIERIGSRARAVGHLNFRADVDGAVRSEALVIDYHGELYPALSVLVAARSLNLDRDDIAVRPGRGMRIGGLEIATDRHLQMKSFFYEGGDGRYPFTVDSFYDVLTGRISADKYRDQIVLVGTTASGVGDFQVTPVSSASPPVITLAHAVSTILQEHYFFSPDWASWAEIGALLLVAVYLIGLVPRLSAPVAAGTGGVLFLGLLGTEMYLLTAESMWLQLATPSALLIIGYAGVLTKRYLVTERGKQRADTESAESNRMLGLSFQSQGQLDTAFEKFRKCPLDDSMMEVLYNLGLDYERKRQFNKAANVYEYMAQHDPKFRDLEERRNRAKVMDETVVLGGGTTAPGGTMILDAGSVEKPKLGRYDVEKELGKGAMGTVYLGRDPKINRVVAIKTLALSQEFEEDELEDVKERFFREAETAGRLNHPNIVTIYDAGEEHDLAYIAMEFLEGGDLSGYVKSGQLLPLAKTLELVARCADALAYAHAQNVVHRDIKPGNIMYDADSDKLTITDFGIARITDSSRTKTGMVLGTPSYMSPEQIAGKKVDGRSDLFSLGVMLYHLAAGQLPFRADSMATLMYRIANEPHEDPRTIREDLPECVCTVIDRAMAKDPAERYADGQSMATDLRACANDIEA